MKKYTIYPNAFLNQTIQAYYHQDYTTFGTDGNPDFLNHLKNQFNDARTDILNNSTFQLLAILKEDLTLLKGIYNDLDLTICVIPRAKQESYYSPNQKIFRQTVSTVVNGLKGLQNGSMYIIRHTNTKTTHLEKSGYGGEGSLPYVGITSKTCNISDEVKGKNILLIDDIYTSGVNVDEDAIQALIDREARSVFFYSVAKTLKKKAFSISDFLA